MADYSDRQLIDVVVSDVASWVDKGNRTIMSGQVTLTLSSSVGPDLAGPHIKASIGLPLPPDTPYKDVELQLLEATRALLERLLKEPTENVRAVYARQRDQRHDPDPLGDLQKELSELTKQ